MDQLPKLYDADEIRSHLLADHGIECDDRSPLLVHMAKHSGDVGRPVRDHFHGPEAHLSEFHVLAESIRAARSDAQLAELGKAAAVADALRAGALGSSDMVEALRAAQEAGLRVDALVSDWQARIYGAEFDAEARYGATDAEQTADRAKDRWHHSEPTRTAERRLAMREELARKQREHLKRMTG